MTETKTRIYLPKENYQVAVDRIKKEFSDFEIPHKNYTGGRHQTTIEFFYAHIAMDSGKPRLAKIEIKKPGGSIFYIKIDKEK